ncbi:hypothetical protein P7C70_g538, partial [Phenoliferia sp. Uapishka_3]
MKTPGIKRIRFQLFDRQYLSFLRRPSDRMTLKEALAALRGVKYVTPPVPLIHQIWALEKSLKSDRSLYALKVAAGTSIYTVLLLARGARSFFVNYTLSSSLITVIVGISPTLGQSLRTFLLQLFGTGMGNIYGLIVLEIFRGVGGYDFNPFALSYIYSVKTSHVLTLDSASYGLAASMALWAGLASYHFYKDPKFYSGGLLAINGAGSLIIEEYISRGILGSTTYPSPALRAAQALAAMSIAILIAATFQLLLFRAPARRQLRLKIAEVTFALSSYNTLLQSNINCLAPADETPVPPVDALDRVQGELIKRERKVQVKVLTRARSDKY